MLLMQHIPDILLSLMAIRSLSQLSPLYTTATRVSQRSLSAFLAVGRGKSKTTELFKSRDDGDDEANSPFSGACSLAAVSTKAVTSHINMKLAGNALTFFRTFRLTPRFPRKQICTVPRKTW